MSIEEKPKCLVIPAFRYTWPGQGERLACLACAAQLVGVANVMGFYLQMIPLTPDGIVKKCSNSKDSDEQPSLESDMNFVYLRHGFEMPPGKIIRRIKGEYIATCNTCQLHSRVEANRAKDVPVELRKMGWATRKKLWLCKSCNFKTH